MTIVDRVKDHLRPHRHRLQGRPWTRALRPLIRLGFAPQTIFDVGVAHGTWELYAIFPEAYYHLVEPAPASLFYMRKIYDHLRGHAEINNWALSDEDGEATFELRPDLQGSTLMISDPEAFDQIVVPTWRFDTVYGVDFARPALVKIDVQGAELRVLQGMAGSLAAVEAILVEVSTLSTVPGGPEAAEVVAFLAGHGLVLHDVLGVLRRPIDGQVSTMDMLFVRADSALRRDRRWE